MLPWRQMLSIFVINQSTISVSGDFHLCQTSVICKYLAEQFGLMPKSQDDKWRADQVNATIHDFVAEGIIVDGVVVVVVVVVVFVFVVVVLCILGFVFNN